MRKRKSGAKPKIDVTHMNDVDLIRHRDALVAEIMRRCSFLHTAIGKLEDQPQKFTGPRLVASKVPPKYRDPKTGTTWAGRGGMPKWMRAAIKAGAKREQFLIKRAA